MNELPELEFGCHAGSVCGYSPFDLVYKPESGILMPIESRRSL